MAAENAAANQTPACRPRTARSTNALPRDRRRPATEWRAGSEASGTTSNGKRVRLKLAEVPHVGERDERMNPLERLVRSRALATCAIQNTTMNTRADPSKAASRQGRLASPVGCSQRRRWTARAVRAAAAELPPATPCIGVAARSALTSVSSDVKTRRAESDKSGRLS